MKKLAIKRLTKSDLTLFEWQFRHRPAGNQKAINLNADVFIDALYPSLPELAKRLEGKIPLDLFLYGPGHAPELNLQRKIIKISSYKNWRLNGEFIYEQPERFQVLESDDLAIMEFVGEGLPNMARVVFLAKAVVEDAGLHERLSNLLPGSRSMAVIGEAGLRAEVLAADVDDDHPIHELLLEEALEDAAFSGVEGTRKLLARRQGRKISKADLLRARERADEIGTVGEELVNAHLTERQRTGSIREFTWASLANSVAPYDFEVENTDGSRLRIDVKSTTGTFERVFHVSVAELRKMAETDCLYRIYRVFELADGTGQLRISDPVQPLAAEILAALGGLPDGVTPDSVSISPTKLVFGPASPLELLDTNEEPDLPFA